MIEGELERRRTEFRVYPTKYRGSARETGARLTAKGVWNPDDVLLAIGGDGTANEAVDGITSLSDVKFGYIPTGSGNDFARGAGIPSDPLQALETVLKGEEKEINIGTALLAPKAEISRQHRHRFLMQASATRRWHKNQEYAEPAASGKTYVCDDCTAAALLSRTVTLDAALENGEHRSFENVLFAVAMNFPYEGGGFCFCPEADGTDDLLDVMVVSNLAKWKVSYLLPMALFGRHTGFPEVHMERCSSLSFQTDRAEPVHLDGESGGHRTEERIGLETERLRLLGDWVKEGMER